MTKIAIIGPGRAGGALAIGLRHAGLDVGPLIYRNNAPHFGGFEQAEMVRFGEIDRVDADVLLIATADQDIRPTAGTLGSFSKLPPVVLHLSGSLASDEIGALREGGVVVGSMHPLVSISDPELGAERLAGAYFCVEGDVEALAAAESLVEALGGKHFSINSELKPLYHASAVMASGNITALFDAAIEMLSKCGLERSEAHEVLLPLLQSTVANLSERSTKDALTGPFVRGDHAALERHLRALKGTVDEKLRMLYLQLAERSVQIDDAGSGILLESISMAKRQTEC